MGMNYYLEREKKFKRPDRIHLGKKSIGWEFAFKSSRALRNFSDIINTVQYGKYDIKNNHGKKIDLNDFLYIVSKSYKEHSRLRKAIGKDENSYIDRFGYVFHKYDFS